MGKQSSIKVMGGSDQNPCEPAVSSETRRSRSRAVSSQRALRAVGYLRRSTDRQEQSIPDQQRAVEQYAKQHDLKLLRCYIDDAISGTSTIGRRSFQQMIADAASPACDFSVVIVYDVKRFGRIDNDEAGYYRHVLRQSGVEVAYASEGFTGDGTDDLLRPVKQWQARQESKDLAKVSIRGLVSKATIGQRSRPEDKAARGFWMGGVPPYGYDLRYESQTGEFLFYVRYQRDGTKLMLDKRSKVIRTLARGESISVSRRDRCTLVPSDEERVGIVRDIFRRYVEEQRGLKAIADAMNRSGVATPRGPEWASQYSGRWAMTTVRAVLINPAYVGDLAWNRRTDARFFRIDGEGRPIERKGASGRRLEPNAEADWIVTENAHPPLVSRRVFLQAKALMERAAAAASGPVPTPHVDRVGASGPRARFLLSGLIRCAHCQSRYEGCLQPRRKSKGSEETGKVYTYACGGYIRHGASTCKRGPVRQEALESAVVAAVMSHYQRFSGPTGHSALSDAVGEAVGAEREASQTRHEEIEAELLRLDEIVRNLLDNMTAINRASVDRRLAEIAATRAALEQEQDELQQATLGREEIRAFVHETAQFIQTLELQLVGVSVTDRQVAIRRCVDTLIYNRETRVVELIIRDIPILSGGPRQSPATRLTLTI